MTYNGASGEMQQEMAETLEFQGMSRSEINQANQTLRLMLENADSQVQLFIANSLMVKDGLFPEASISGK